MNKKHTLMIASLAFALVLSGCSNDQSSNSGSTGNGGSSTPNQSETSTENQSSESSSESNIEDGSKAHPYKIENREDLIALQEKVNNETFDGYVQNIDNAPHYKLTADIDLGGMEWTPIGNTINEDGTNIFSANFDGDGHTISNFKITNHESDVFAYGLFGFFHGYMHNLKVVDFTINLVPTVAFGTNYVGGVVAYADLSAFDNIVAKGDITFTLSEATVGAVLGGAIGYADSYRQKMEDGSEKGSVTFMRFIETDVNIKSTYENSFVGGSIGYISTTGGGAINNLAYITSRGKLESANVTGGITAYMDQYTTISFAYAYNKSIIGRSVAGGIAGAATNDTVINNCFVATKTITVAETQASGALTVGSLVGLYMPFNNPETMTLSTLMLDCYVSMSTQVKLRHLIQDDPNQTPKIASSELVKESFLSSELGFTNIEFTFHDSDYPTLNIGADINWSAKVKVNFITNMEGVKYDEITISKYDFETFPFKNPTKPGHTFKGWYYDPDCTIDYRFYLPMQFDTTLYADWAAYAEFANMFVIDDLYGMILEFNDDGTMTSYYSDYTYSNGSYAYYDDYIYFETEATLIDGGWGLTYASWDKTSGKLQFQSSNASSSLFSYVVASDLIGFYRNGRYSLDFLTAKAGVLTIPTDTEIVNIDFTYEESETGVTAQTKKDNKPIEITVLNDGSIKVVYEGQTIENLKKIPMKSQYVAGSKETPWVGKNYTTIELNNNIGVKDLQFEENGIALMRTSYAGRVNMEEARVIDKDKSDDNLDNVHWEYSYESETPETADKFIRDITKNKDGKTYTYTETTKGYLDNQLVTETKVLCETLTKQVLRDGSILFTGKHNAYGKGSTYYVEFVIDAAKNTIKYNNYVSHYYGGGFYNDEHNVYLKSTGGFDTISTVLNYNAEKDYFTMTSKNGVNFMLAPYECYGVFNIEGVEALNGFRVFAYHGNHTYLMDKTGNITDLTIKSGDFNNDSNVTLTINGTDYAFAVTNLFERNVLTKI